MKRRTILIIIIAIIFIVFITEFVIRITYKDNFDRYQPFPINFQPDSAVGFTFKRNSSFFIHGTKVNINNEGFIGDNFSKYKKKRTFRIIFVGSCSVSGTVHLNFYSNFCTTVQKLFNENGWNVEVLNFGIEGDGRSFENFNTIKYKALNFNPDLILAGSDFPFFSSNFTREIYRGNFLEYPKGNFKLREELKNKIDELFKPKYKLLFLLYDNSYTVKAIHNYFLHKGYNTPLIEILFLHYCRRCANNMGRPKYWTVEKSVEMMKTLSDELKQKNINFFYFNYTKNPEMEYFFKDHQLPLISLFNNDEFTSSMFYYNDSHFSPLGYKAIGERFFKILTNDRIVPELYSKKSNALKK